MQSWDLFNFNYDPASYAAATRSIPLYSASGLSVTCEGCYAHLEAGLTFEWVVSGSLLFPFLSNELLKVGGWRRGQGVTYRMVRYMVCDRR